MASTALANPIGGSVVAGSAVIVPSTPKVLDVNQSTNKAIINWGSFNIAPDETTNFNQPNAGSVTLNRIGSANPSQILGNLNANGQLMLVNPNGVFFGKQAKVDVNSLLATTSDINNTDFLNGKYVFSKAGNPNAQVVNNGNITADPKGYVALSAPAATNNGVINAPYGRVAIAGTDVFTLDPYGDKLINFALPKGVVRSGPEGNAANATNTGKIYADEGRIELTAKAAKASLESVVNMDGLAQARSSKHKQGSVYLSADNVSIPGEIDVSGDGEKADGGKIEAYAKKHLSFTGDANASGGNGGYDEELAKNGGHGNKDGNGGTIWMQGDTVALGGTASVGSENGKGGKATFKAGKTFDVGSSEAYTIADAVSHGGTINVLADDTINVDSDINADEMAMLSKKNGHGHNHHGDGEDGGYPDVLNFGDGNANGKLTINLNGKITVPEDTALTGDGTKVNVSDKGSIQNGVDVASTAGADIGVAEGVYDENVNVYKNNINLHSAGGSGFQKVAYDGDDDYDGKPVIDGYVNVTADADTVNGFKILGGELNGETVGVNVEDGSNAKILNNTIALGDSDYGESDMTLAKNGQYGDYGNGHGHGTGIKLDDAQNAQIKGNKVTGANTGIALNDSDRSIVDSNEVHADKTGIDVNDSSYVNVDNNTVSGNAWDDGHHHNHDDLAAKNGHGGYGSDPTVGINLNDATNAKVRKNTINNVDTAVKVKDSPNVEVSRNVANNVANGTIADNADNLLYERNTMNGRSNYYGDGLFLKDSANAKVSHNKHNGFKNKLRLVNSNTTVKSNNNF